MLVQLFREASRRRVFRTAALYIVWAWLALQVADVLFPAFDLPETAKRPLLWAVLGGFPLVLVFGWLFDVDSGGIHRTGTATEAELAAAATLKRGDYLVLAALAVVLAAILWSATRTVMEAPRLEPVLATTPESPPAEPVARLANSIAVLPFANISSDPDNEYFCDGISEEILNRLGTFQGLNVIARTSSFAFKGSQHAAVRLGELLGVRYLLQGSVRKAGEQLRISVQLLDEAGVQVWQQSFDRRMENVFAIQTEIAEAVAQRVAPQVAAPLATRAHQPDLAAYDHYLRGRELLHRRRIPDARAALQRALEIDGDFAEAHAEYALSLSIGATADSQLRKVRAALDRAVALQPGLLRAEAVQGLYLQIVQPPDNAGSERVLRAVLERDPNMSDALNWLSNTLRAQGREDEAFEVLQRANRIDPLHPSIAANLAASYSDRDQPEQAEAVLVRVAEVHGASSMLRDFYQSTGRLVDLHRVARRQIVEGKQLQYYGQALSYALLGDMERAQFWLDASQRDHPEVFVVPWFPTLIPGWQGRYADATREFQRVAAEQATVHEELENFLKAWLGRYPALGGDCAGSLRLLEPIFPQDKDGEQRRSNTEDEVNIDAWHALAWCRQQLGDTARAQAMLQPYEREFVRLETRKARPNGQEWFRAARNALLAGDTELALARLERAVAAGWRDYYLQPGDPRWKPLQQDPRYQRLMQQVRDDIARQRREVEQLDAAEDMVSLYEARKRRQPAGS